MKTFNYTIKDPAGIHARPAGVIVQEAKKWQSSIICKSNGKQADMKRIFAVMSLCMKQGQEMIVEITGIDEEEASKALQNALENNL